MTAVMEAASCHWPILQGHSTGKMGTSTLLQGTESITSIPESISALATLTNQTMAANYGPVSDMHRYSKSPSADLVTVP